MRHSRFEIRSWVVFLLLSVLIHALVIQLVSLSEEHKGQGRLIVTLQPVSVSLRTVAASTPPGQTPTASDDKSAEPVPEAFQSADELPARVETEPTPQDPKPTPIKAESAPAKTEPTPILPKPIPQVSKQKIPPPPQPPKRPVPVPSSSRQALPSPVAPTDTAASVSAASSGEEATAEESSALPVTTTFGSEDGPRLLKMPEPDYPMRARRLHQEGRVLVRLELDRYGKLQRARIEQSAGASLDSAALKAVRAARFAPALKNGRGVASIALLPIDFKLRP